MPTAEGLAEPLRSRWSPSVFDDEHEVERRPGRDVAPGRAVGAELGQHPAVAVLRRAPRRHDARRAGRAPQPRQQHLGSARLGRAAHGHPARPDEDGEGGGEHAAYDLGQAAAHITLQARSMGLHAHQFAGFDRAARRRAPRRTPPLRGDQRDRDRSSGRPGRGRRAAPRPRGPGPPSPAARGVRVRRLLGHTLAGPLNRRAARRHPARRPRARHQPADPAQHLAGHRRGST